MKRREKTTSWAAAEQRSSSPVWEEIIPPRKRRRRDDRGMEQLSPWRSQEEHPVTLLPWGEHLVRRTLLSDIHPHYQQESSRSTVTWSNILLLLDWRGVDSETSAYTCGCVLVLIFCTDFFLNNKICILQAMWGHLRGPGLRGKGRGKGVSCDGWVRLGS